MKIALSLIFFFASFHLHANCEFNSQLKKIVSFSGTTTVLLRELGLLQSPKLYGISVFNPIAKNEFKGRIYPGGIFLSQNSFSDIKDALVFFDESRDLRRILESQHIQVEEIKTRNLTPDETIEKTLTLLKKYTHNCDAEMVKLRLKVTEYQTSILKRLTLKEIPSMVFYLGNTLGSRLPEMLMVNDGIVKWLLNKKKIHTYPSELAYVNWSAKLLNQMPKETKHIGIIDSGQSMKKTVLKKSEKWTLEYPGSLVPGYSQLEAFAFLFDKM